MTPSSRPPRPTNPGRPAGAGGRVSHRALRGSAPEPAASGGRRPGPPDGGRRGRPLSPPGTGAGAPAETDRAAADHGPLDGTVVARSGDAAEANGRAERAGRRSGWGSPDARGVPWTRMLFIGVVCFAVWFLLDAPSLQRSAEVSPIGTRRTVSLDVVGPVAALSRGLGLSHVVGWADGLFGRTPGGGPTLAALSPAPSSRHGTVPLTGTRHHSSHTTAPTGPGTTTPTTFPVLDTRPTAANPLRVLIVGDSVGLDLGQALEADLGNTGVVSSQLDGRVDTGLSRPDYFNWPAELQIDLQNDHPNLVVVMIGANDPQSLVGTSGAVPYGSPSWTGEYGRRVGAFIDEANATGAHVLWVGMPPMGNPLLNAEMQQINGIVQSEVAKRTSKALYLSSAPVLGGAHGGYTAYLTNPGGAAVNVRTTDGIHLTPGGAELLSQAVMAGLRSDFQIALPH